MVKGLPSPPFAYSQKQDIFAFGHLLFETVFGRKLVGGSLPRYEQLYSWGDVRRVIMKCTEGLELAEASVWGRVLLVLALKCLDPDPVRRPQLDWLGIMLRRILDHKLIL